MTGKEIIKELDENFNGLATVKYDLRYANGKDYRKEKIHWLMDMFSCSYGIANRIVAKANGYIG